MEKNTAGAAFLKSSNESVKSLPPPEEKQKKLRTTVVVCSDGEHDSQSRPPDLKLSRPEYGYHFRTPELSRRVRSERRGHRAIPSSGHPDCCVRG